MAGAPKGSPVRSCKLAFQSPTLWKQAHLENLRYHYRLALIYYVEALWQAIGLNGDNITEECFEKHPRYPYNRFKIPKPETMLSTQMLSCVMDHALELVDTILAKLRKRYKWLHDCESGKVAGDPEFVKGLIEKDIAKLKCPYVRPNVTIKIEGKNSQIAITDHLSFDYMLTINTIYDKDVKRKVGLPGNKLHIPINSCRYNNMLNFFSIHRCSGIRLDEKSVTLNYNFPRTKEDAYPDGERNRYIAIDQGVAHILTAVDNLGKVFMSDVEDGKQTYSEVMHEKTKAKPGSKRFAALQEKVKNMVNGAVNDFINHMDLSTVSVIYLEDIRKMGKGQKSGLFLKRFAHGVLRDKLKLVCEMFGIKLVNSPNRYKSQRCSRCGFTHAKNRKSQDKFVCKHCGYTDNADVNACRNHLDRTLKGIHWTIPESHTCGFFWNGDDIIICKEEANEKERKPELVPLFE